MTFGKRLAWPALHELCEYIELAHYQAASLVSGTVRKFTKDKKRPATSTSWGLRFDNFCLEYDLREYKSCWIYYWSLLRLMIIVLVVMCCTNSHQASYARAATFGQRYIIGRTNVWWISWLFEPPLTRNQLPFFLEKCPTHIQNAFAAALLAHSL